MKISQKRLVIAGWSVVLALCMVLPAAGAALSSPSTLSSRSPSKRSSNAPQYWGLIFAVGTYYNRPDEDRPEMIDAANNLYSTLTSSPNWQADHIHMLTASQATGKNLIHELIWLAKNAKPGDFVLVYLTSHGGQMRNAQGLPMDLPPKDEADGMDEFLVMYNGFDKPYCIVWDDLLNFFLSRIKCQGLCLIVDSCYSGGFNDPPMKAGESRAAEAQAYTKDFAKSLSGQNRVVLMSTEENALSFGAFFSDFIIQGLQGSADAAGNHDGVNSAEETFAYASPLTTFWVWVYSYGQFTEYPQMADGYPGELPLT